MLESVIFILPWVYIAPPLALELAVSIVVFVIFIFASFVNTNASKSRLKCLEEKYIAPPLPSAACVFLIIVFATDKFPAYEFIAPASPSAWIFSKIQPSIIVSYCVNIAPLSPPVPVASLNDFMFVKFVFVIFTGRVP